MNNTGSFPSGEIGGSTKVLLLLVILFIGLIFIASSSLAEVDLTPNNAPVMAEAVPPADSNVITIPNSSAGNFNDGSTTTGAAAGNSVQTEQDILQVPVTGTCTDPYIVRSGDMLSAIAAMCNTSIAVIRTANPDIQNINLIYPGQELRIPGASSGASVQPTVIPVTGGGQAAPFVIATQATGNAIAANPATGQAAPSGAPVIRPGTGMQVKALSFPAETEVNVAIGPESAGYTVVSKGITDANGNLITEIVIPAAPDPNAAWVVVVATVNTVDIVQASSDPFYIASQ